MGQSSSSAASTPRRGGAGAGVSAALAAKLPHVPVAALRSGDVVLIRQVMRTALGAISTGVLRGVAATQRGNYFSAQEQHIAGWSHCGIIVVHKSKPYLLMPTLSGIEVFPAAKRIRNLQKEGARVAVRQLQHTLTHEQEAVFVDLLHAALRGCDWERYLPELIADNVSQRFAFGANQAMVLPTTDVAVPSAASQPSRPQSSPRALPTTPGAVPQLSIPDFTVAPSGAASSAPTTARSAATSGSGRSSSSTLSPYARHLIRMVIPRVWAALCSVPPAMELELRRAFNKVDDDHDGFVTLTQVRKVLTEFHGSDAVAGEVDSTVAALPSDAVDAGRITFNSLLAAFARRQLKAIPVEHDLEAILCGEFVAVVYEQLGLLPERNFTALEPFHAERRSSAASTATSDYGSSSVHAYGASSAHHARGSFAGAPQASATLQAAHALAVHEAEASAFLTGQASPQGLLNGSARPLDAGIAARGSPASTSRRVALSGGLYTPPPQCDTSTAGVSSVGGDVAPPPFSAPEAMVTFGSPGRPPTHTSSGGLPSSSFLVSPTRDVTASMMSPSSKASLTSARHKDSMRRRGTTIVIVHAGTGDFRHFTPVTFSSSHVPKLKLLYGTLASEALVDTTSADDSLPRAKETVRELTTALAGTSILAAPPPTSVVTSPPASSAVAPHMSDLATGREHGRLTEPVVPGLLQSTSSVRAMSSSMNHMAGTRSSNNAMPPPFAAVGAATAASPGSSSFSGLGALAPRIATIH